MKAVFISIFPELIESFFSVGVINKASKESILDYDTVNPIKFLKKNERLDDSPYGGGPGMLIRTEPLDKAIKEAKLFGDVVEVASSKDKNFNYIPKDYAIPSGLDYLHITTNNTIFGTQLNAQGTLVGGRKKIVPRSHWRNKAA